MRRLFIIILVLCTVSCAARLARLNHYEKCWALLHPFASLKIKHISKRCYAIYYQPFVKQQLDSFAGGGQLDAFRHVFFMAAYAQKIKTKKLEKLGIAHEKGNYLQFLQAQKEEGEAPDSLATVMDLANNMLGLRTGHANKKLSLEELKLLVIKAIRNGDALILKRNKTGHYVDCSNRVLNLSLYAGKWAVPKCLVSSNGP